MDISLWIRVRKYRANLWYFLVSVFRIISFYLIDHQLRIKIAYLLSLWLLNWEFVQFAVQIFINHLLLLNLRLFFWPEGYFYERSLTLRLKHMRKVTKYTSWKKYNWNLETVSTFLHLSTCVKYEVHKNINFPNVIVYIFQLSLYYSKMTCM